MKKFLILSMCLASPLAAAELDPAQIPESAKWLLHADLDAMRGSDAGSAVLQQIREEHEAKLNAARRMFALHPLDDLTSVTLFGDGRRDHGVALIKGKLDQAHLTDIVKAAEDYRSETRGELTIHTWTDKGQVQHAAFFAGDLLVFSRQRDLLGLALETLENGGSWKPDGFFDTPAGAPLIMAEAKLSEIEMSEEEARMLGMSNVLRLSVGESDGSLELRLGSETPDKQSAEFLSRIVDGVIAFGQALEPKLKGLALDPEVRVTGDPGVLATLRLPTADWTTLLKRAAGEKKTDEP